MFLQTQPFLAAEGPEVTLGDTEVLFADEQGGGEGGFGKRVGFVNGLCCGEGAL